MATKRQIEEQDRQSDLRRRDAVREIMHHVIVPVTGDDPDDSPRGLAVGVFDAFLLALEGEQADVEALRRKGWQSAVKALAETRTVVRGWRDLLVEFRPAAGRPEPKPVASAQFVEPARRDEGVDGLEQRLVDAFGPELAPADYPRHIRTTLEPEDSAGPLEVDGVAPRYGALCGSKVGSWTHRSGTNCEDCAAAYDLEHGPYNGPGPTPFKTPPGSDGQGEVRNSDEGHRIDEPVTPAVATAIREEIEAERAPAMPPIVEPTGPQARPRMTPLEVRAHGQARQRGAKHRSVSQVTGYSDCGTRYAIDDMEPPAWWNVGGKALHRCVEHLNRLAVNDDTAVEVLGDTTGMFGNAFGVEIHDATLTSTVPQEHWRVANRGKENFDWWRVEGPEMVTRYVAWLINRLADGWEIARTQVGLPVIEFECHLNVGALVPNLSIVDLALVHPQFNLLEVIDCKAGGSAPKDTFQLGVYGWALLGAGIAGFTPLPDLSNVRGRYWRARTGACVPDESVAGWPVLSAHPWASVVHRYQEQDSMERQGFYPPNVSSFCGGCGVRDLCPAQSNL
jgi:hypothetical protein